jgi:hypothetical protein
MTAASLVALLKKHPIGTACLIVILVCGGLLYYRADVTVQSQTAYNARLAEADKMIDNVKGAAGLAEQVAEIQALSKELESRLVRADQLAVNLQYFYKMEADHGVKLIDVRQNSVPVRRGAAKPLFTPVPFSLTVQGSYVQLVKFLGELQNGRHLCRINIASFTKAGAGDGTTVPADITLTLTLELLGQS